MNNSKTYQSNHFRFKLRLNIAKSLKVTSNLVTDLEPLEDIINNLGLGGGE